MNGERTLTCAEFAEAADELALGHLDEPRRGRLLAHAAGCDRCATLVADLATVTDRLLELTPEADPPPGFEERTVARLATPRPPGWQRRSALVFGGAALAAVLVLGLAVLGGRDGPRRGTILDRDGEPVGTVELAEAGDTRLVLTMPGPHDWPGEWTCELLAPHGGWVEVGRWTAEDVANHVWDTSVDEDHDGATAMRILNSRGAVIATAALD